MKHTACLSLLLALLLALSLPAAALEAAADSIAALGDQELLTLYQLVTREAKARGLSLNAAISCPAGRYIVGQDIAEGVYRITCTATAGDDVTRAIGGLGSVYEGLGGETSAYGALFSSLGSLYAAADEGALVEIVGDFGVTQRSFHLKKGQSVDITLSGRVALVISDGTCELETGLTQ